MLYRNDRYPHVFSPVQVGKLTLKNRLGFSPMVCNQCDIDGTVTDAMVDFVARQADTGVGYVTIGDTQVDDERGGAFMSTLNIARRTSVPGLIRLNEAARYHGAVLSVELNHSGRGAKDYLISGPALAPSAIPFPGCAKNIKEMDADDLKTVKRKFVDCAKNCVRGGFRMLMLHCAHNNMLGQFLSPLSNHRTDAYGGSPENRRRYPLEVLAAIREAVGPDVAIEIRVSATEMTPGGLEFGESLEFMQAAQAYADLIHVSRGIVYNDAGIYTLPTFLREPCLNVEWARKVKKSLQKPVAVVGNFSSLEEAEEVISSGAADIVCMARAYLADAQMIQKSLAGHADEVRPCLRCHRGCIDNSARGKAIHCAVNPSLGFEPEIRMMRSGVDSHGLTREMEAAVTKYYVNCSASNSEAPLEVNYVNCNALDNKAPIEKDYVNCNSSSGGFLDDKDDVNFSASSGEPIAEKVDGNLRASSVVVPAEKDDVTDKQRTAVRFDGKHFLVVGGGPAGMTAAQTLSFAGHDVTLCEKSDRLGGLLRDASAPACKGYMKKYLEWIIAETYRSGAKVLLNTEVTAADAGCFDAVLIGTGSTYLRPPIEGIDLPHVIMLQEADEHPERLAEHLVICGGGSSGLETALSLAREGHQVTVVDMAPLEQFAGGMVYFPRVDLMQELEKAGVKLMPQMKIVRFVPEGVELENMAQAKTVTETITETVPASAEGIAVDSGEEIQVDESEGLLIDTEEVADVKSGVDADGRVGQTVVEFLPADQCIIALGVRKNTALLDELRAIYADGIVPIGDCEGGNNIYDATHSAYFAALQVM